MSPVEVMLEEYKRRLTGRETAVQSDLVRRWRRVEDSLSGHMDALVMDMDALRAAGQPVSRNAVYRLERYRTLLTQLDAEQRRYADAAAGLISAEQQYALQMGFDWGADAVGLLAREAGITVAFNRLDRAVVEAMVGYAADGTPLAQLLAADYPATAAALTDALVEGVALGYNPRKVARMMRDAMAGNAQRALVVARTETQRAHRSAAVESYRQSGIIQEYIRYAAMDSRTCLACLLESGRRYPVTEQFSDHVLGRCTCLPIIPGVASPVEQTGREWLEAQSAETQRDIMGAGHYDAWKSGAVPLESMSQMHTDPVWGEAPRVVPLRELVERGGGRTPAAAPQGAPMSGAINLAKNLSGASGAGPAVQEALAAIDQVHGVPQMATVKAAGMSGTNLLGEYRYDATSGKPIGIKVSKDSDVPSLTAAHELGHYLDHQDLGSKGDYSSNSLDTLQGWRQAAYSSPTVTNIRNRAHETYTGINGQEYTKTNPYMAYLSSEREVFARSYSQYIATRSGNPALLADLRRVQNGDSGLSRNTQWSDEEFTPIGKAFDDLFAVLGLRG